MNKYLNDQHLNKKKIQKPCFRVCFYSMDPRVPCCEVRGVSQPNVALAHCAQVSCFAEVALLICYV